MDNAGDFLLKSVTDGDVIEAHPVSAGIPDRYLFRAIGACCTEDYGRLRLSKPVRDLSTRYAPADRPKMNRIPQERRRQFLNELASPFNRRHVFAAALTSLNTMSLAVLADRAALVRMVR